MLIKLEKLSSSTKPVTQECKGGNHRLGRLSWESLWGGRGRCRIKISLSGEGTVEGGWVILSISTLCEALEIDARGTSVL